MATPFKDIYGLAMITIRDYKLDNLYKLDKEAFFLTLQGFLIRGKDRFVSCIKPLDVDEVQGEFLSDLSDMEKSILADLTVIEWFTSKTQDVTQFQLHLSDKDFRTYSESNNLKEKSEYLDRLREKCRQSMVDYQLQNLSNIPFFNNQ